MRSKTKMPGKVECLNPNTGGRLNIEAGTYELFSKAIYQTLQSSKAPLTFTQIVEGVKDCLRQQQTAFDGSVDWYAITVKSDLQAKGIIEAYTEKGKKLHRLGKAK